MVDKLTPKIVNTDKWISISAGFQYSLGIKADSSLFSWGANLNGQLGDGTGVQKNTPTQIGNPRKWSSISAAGVYAFAISSDKKLFSWGFNGNGQLGLGSTTQMDTIVQVGTESNWKYVATSKPYYYNNSVYGAHTLALKNNSNVICTAGANYVSQLGNGTTSDLQYFECNTGLITSLDEPMQLSKLEVSIYPNPSNGVFNIEISQELAYTNIVSIYSSTGMLIENYKQTDNNFSIDLTNYSKGIYLLIIENDIGSIKKKLIVE